MSFENGHWYTLFGAPCHTQVKKDGGLRPTTLRDAKKLNLLPSVTTILKVLDKPALTAWKIEQAVDAVLTSPRVSGEEIDAFKKRVLYADKEQDEIAQQAADLGTEIHSAAECYLSGEKDRVAPRLMPYIEPAMRFLTDQGGVEEQEKVVVGKGYAGRVDLVMHWVKEGRILIDIKSTKKLPEREAWKEHVLQTAFYAAAWPKVVAVTGNLYISTTEIGKYAFHLHTEPWLEVYDNACVPLVQLWAWMNDHDVLSL